MDDLPEIDYDTSTTDDDYDDDDDTSNNKDEESAVADASSAASAVTDAVPAAAAVVGAAPVPRGDKMCRCGSTDHLTTQARRCPLNKSSDVLEIFPGDEYKRLLRYVPRNYLYRYYNYSLGSVTAVDPETCELTISWAEGGSDNVTEEELLKIFAQMKKDFSRKRKRGGSAEIPRRRLFPARK